MKDIPTGTRVGSSPYNLKLYEHDNKPREDAVRITRLDASVGLVVLAGYTPRWLEEIK